MRSLFRLGFAGCLLLMTATQCAPTKPAAPTQPVVDRPGKPQPMPAPGPITGPRKVVERPGIVPGPLVGAAQLEQYLPQLAERRVALVVNQTSRVGRTHLLDTLRAAGVNVVRVLAPEHGFRGTAGAGEVVNDSVDTRTGVPVTSLYGTTKKPLPKHLADADVVVFDLQDVGARFYTYLSTLHYVLEACAEQHKRVIVLDRPNPNGDYVDGPVLEADCRSFVGVDPLPIVHGLTLGEAARMMNGEGWLAGGVKADLTVVPVGRYTHATPYELPVAPSPNLRTARAVRYYPSLCLFEGTPASVGRGTAQPFEVVGHPAYPDTAFSFVPRPTPANAKPVLVDQRCYGPQLPAHPPRFALGILLDFYRKMPKAQQAAFLTPFFDKLAGTKTLRQQIEKGLNEDLIRTSWQPALLAYKAKRTKYLLYPDAEPAPKPLVRPDK